MAERPDRRGDIGDNFCLGLCSLFGIVEWKTKAGGDPLRLRSGLGLSELDKT